MNRNNPQRTPSNPIARQDEELSLRRRILKLRWMRLEREADRAAAELASLGSGEPPTLPRVPAATD
jgi:hypothetical protein